MKRISFRPEQQCHRCKEPTVFAFIDDEDEEEEAIFLPVCAEHGYYEINEHATDEEKDLELVSITRFALSIHPGVQSVRVAGRVEPTGVPGWEPRNLVDDNGDPLPDRRKYGDLAWAIRGKINGTAFTGWCVWSLDTQEFEWFDGPFGESEVSTATQYAMSQLDEILEGQMHLRTRMKLLVEQKELAPDDADLVIVGMKSIVLSLKMMMDDLQIRGKEDQ